MKEVVFWKANDVQVGTEKLPIFQDEADCLVKAIFPGKNIHDLCKEFEFSENVHFSGEIRIIPDTAIRFNGYLLDKDEPSYAFDVNLSASNSQLFGARLEKLPESQNIGWGRPIYRSLKRMAINNGLQEFIVHPGLEDGGWYWARLGAVPIDELESQTLKEDYLLPRLEKYKDQLTSEEYDAALLAIQKISDDPSHLETVSRLSGKIQTDEGEEKLGRILLRGSKWMARVPLSEDIPENRLSAYSAQTSEVLSTMKPNPFHEAFRTFCHIWEELQKFTR